MANYKLSNTAKEDLIRIHHYGVERFGMLQADAYFNAFFDHFEMIAQQPLSLNQSILLRMVIVAVFVVQMLFTIK